MNLEHIFNISFIEALGIKNKANCGVVDVMKLGEIIEKLSECEYSKPVIIFVEQPAKSVVEDESMLTAIKFYLASSPYIATKYCGDYNQIAITVSEAITFSTVSDVLGSLQSIIGQSHPDGLYKEIVFTEDSEVYISISDYRLTGIGVAEVIDMMDVVVIITHDFEN